MVQSADLRRFHMLIGSDWVNASSGEAFQTDNPYTGMPWAAIPTAAAVDVDLAVARAREALEGPWGALTATARGRLVRRLGELVAEHAQELAVLETTDNGKLLKEMLGQLRAIPGWYEYFGGMADKLEGTVPQDTKPNIFAYTRYEPLGVVAAILSWNSPLLLLTNKLAPGLAAGCTFVAKPAVEASASVLEFARLFEIAGFPAGVFNVVTGGAEVGRQLAAHIGVDKVAFTGSTSGGIAVMKTAADHVARVTLELGGKSPNVVFDDANMDAAVNGVVAGIFAAGGQTCVAGSRLLVHRSKQEELVERLMTRAAAIRMGDPLDLATEMGPIACLPQLQKVEMYVRSASEQGATVAFGGTRPEAPELSSGYFFEPTVLTNVNTDMRAVREEIFGPVLSVIPFDTEEEAVRLANDTSYGLAAGIWTQSIQRAHRVAHRIRAGSVWINEYRTVAYNVPFGGFKESGIGRENGVDAIREYVEPKAIWVNLSEETRDPFMIG